MQKARIQSGCGPFVLRVPRFDYAAGGVCALALIWMSL